MDNKTLVRELFEAVSDRRAENLPDYLALDVVDHNKMIHGEPDEPGAAFEGIRMQLAAFDPLTMHVDELIAEGDRVTARITMSGTHTGTHIRMPRPTGRHFEIEAVFILTLGGGKGHRDPRRQRPPGPVPPARLGLADGGLGSAPAGSDYPDSVPSRHEAAGIEGTPARARRTRRRGPARTPRTPHLCRRPRDVAVPAERPAHRGRRRPVRLRPPGGLAPARDPRRQGTRAGRGDAARRGRGPLHRHRRPPERRTRPHRRPPRRHRADHRAQHGGPPGRHDVRGVGRHRPRPDQRREGG